MSYKMKWEVFSLSTSFIMKQIEVYAVWSINFKIYQNYPLYIDTHMCVYMSMSHVPRDSTAFAGLARLGHKHLVRVK